LSTRTLYAVKEFSKPEMVFWFRKLQELTAENPVIVTFRLMNLMTGKFLMKLTPKVYHAGTH